MLHLIFLAKLVFADVIFGPRSVILEVFDEFNEPEFRQSLILLLSDKQIEEPPELYVNIHGYYAAGRPRFFYSQHPVRMLQHKACVQVKGDKTLSF